MHACNFVLSNAGLDGGCLNVHGMGGWQCSWAPSCKMKIMATAPSIARLTERLASATIPPTLPAAHHVTAAAAVSSLRAGCQVYTLMEQGSNARMVGATKVNEASSRSHAVFIVIVEKSTSGFPETRSSPGERSTSARGLWHAIPALLVR